MIRVWDIPLVGKTATAEHDMLVELTSKQIDLENVDARAQTT